MAASKTLFVAFFTLTLYSIVIAKSHVHLGPRGTEESSILRSRVAAKRVKLVPKQNAESGGADGFTFEEDVEEEEVVVEVEAEILKDVVIWEELEEDGISILSCTRDVETRDASIVLSGESLNSTDYGKGVAFAIGSDSWEENCGPVEKVDGIDENDDYLFYVIKNATAEDETVSLSMTIVPGSEVVPEVGLTVIPEEDPRRLPRKIVFEEEMSFSETSRLVSGFENNTLPVSVRPTISGDATINLFDGATLNVAASLRADIKDFRVRRSFRLKVEWTQILEASFDASLVVDLEELSGRKTGDIFRKPVPGFGFSQKIIFVGRVRAGAFVILQWLVELDLEGGLDASVSAAYQSHRRVKAQLIPPKISSTNILPEAQGSSGDSAIDFTRTVEIDDPKFTGFAGLRPALGLEATLNRKGIGGNIGASLGLQAQGVARKPAFLPFTEGGRTIGACSDCHYFRGSAAVVGKDLNLQLEKNGKPKGSPKTLVKDLFTIPLGTLCAFKGTCPAPTPSPSRSALPTPTSTPSPSASASTSPIAPTPTSSPTQSPSPSASPSTSASASASASASPAPPTPSTTPSASYSASPIATPSASSSATPSASPSATPSASASPMAETPSPSVTPSSPASASVTPSPPASASPLPSASQSAAPSPLPSQTPTPSAFPEFDADGCRTCSLNKPCGSGESCVNNSCKELISFGAQCRPCTACGGFCFSGRCIPSLGGIGPGFGFRNAEDMIEASPFPDMELDEISITPDPVEAF